MAHSLQIMMIIVIVIIIIAMVMDVFVHVFIMALILFFISCFALWALSSVHSSRFLFYFEVSVSCALCQDRY